jgi:hypoxanthine phosphoribosyltransferase
MILFTSEQIQDKVKEMALTISFKHTSKDDIVMICLLNGGFMFFSDLVKNVSLDFECDFIRVKSYKGQEQGLIHITKDIETDIEGKIVYIVDDFYDTGNTLDIVVEHLSTRNPKSIEMITLLTRDISPIPDYPLHTGFTIKDEWVYGYGLDDNGLKRNLPFICAI